MTYLHFGCSPWLWKDGDISVGDLSQRVGDVGLVHNDGEPTVSTPASPFSIAV